MVTGKPINALRRRLKFASVFNNIVLLEGGALDISAGPSLTWRAPLPIDTRWQTPRQRAAAQQAPFSIGIGKEETPGVPAERMNAVTTSDTSYSWRTTFEPFRAELPAGCDWIEYVQAQYSNFSVVRRLADDWIKADKNNPALERAIPARLARGQVIDAANLDLAAIATAAPTLSGSFDALHTQVIAQRLARDSGWRLEGFTAPILLPRVGELSWAAVADLRRDRHVSRLREVLREIEADGLEEALAGDVEAAAHHAYERFLSKGRVETRAGSIAGETLLSIVVSAGGSIGTLGLSPMLAIPIGAAAAVGQTVTTRAVRRYQGRRRDGWLTIVQRLS
jgi:hypothetical protein